MENNRGCRLESLVKGSGPGSDGGGWGGVPLLRTTARTRPLFHTASLSHELQTKTPRTKTPVLKRLVGQKLPNRIFGLKLRIRIFGLNRSEPNGTDRQKLPGLSENPVA